MWNHLKGLALLLLAVPAVADETGDDVASQAPKTLSGMSVLGNNEAPKSLVIVPWKSSQIGDGIGVVESLSNRPMPVDREVFGRELQYYRIRSSAPKSAANTGSDVRVTIR